jgi:hypothetical protein
MKALLGLALLAAAPAQAGPPPAPSRADFGVEPASEPARRIADWVVASGDNLGLPFMVIDKSGAKALAFDANGRLRGAAPVLLGLAKGDVSPPGIGDKKLADIAPAQRITPAGRFLAALGNDLGKQDILWVDYASAISLHRVVTGKPGERRHHRLTTASVLDNRITYGCINVPASFFDSVVRPAFKGTNGFVYVLPEATPLHKVFPLHASTQPDLRDAAYQDLRNEAEVPPPPRWTSRRATG